MQVGLAYALRRRLRALTATYDALPFAGPCATCVLTLAIACFDERLPFAAGRARSTLAFALGLRSASETFCGPCGRIR